MALALKRRLKESVIIRVDDDVEIEVTLLATRRNEAKLVFHSINPKERVRFFRKELLEPEHKEDARIARVMGEDEVW